jgi:hypothetical protein
MDEAEENEKDTKETVKTDKTREDDLARTKKFERQINLLFVRGNLRYHRLVAYY